MVASNTQVQINAQVGSRSNAQGTMLRKIAISFLISAPFLGAGAYGFARSELPIWAASVVFLVGVLLAFLGQLDGSIPFDLTGPDSSLISGFYTKEIGGTNGITPLGTGWYLVMDEPSVFDRRVSSHEVGHILGLRHTLNDRSTPARMA